MTDIAWQYQKAITLDVVTCKHTFVCLRKKIERRMRSRSVANRDDTSALLNPP